MGREVTKGKFCFQINSGIPQASKSENKRVEIQKLLENTQDFNSQYSVEEKFINSFINTSLDGQLKFHVHLDFLSLGYNVGEFHHLHKQTEINNELGENEPGRDELTILAASSRLSMGRILKSLAPSNALASSTRVPESTSLGRHCIPRGTGYIITPPTLQPDNHRDLQLEGTGCINDALGNDITPHDATKDVHQNSENLWQNGTITMELSL